MVDAFLQAEAEDLFRLSWMQSLAGRLGVLQKQLQQMQATQDDSSPRIDALAEEESGEETTDELAPTSSTAHQQQKLQATPGDNAETASDTSHFSTDLHRGWQQIKLDMQSAVEQQLVQIGHAAALQARTQLRMGPLAEGSLPGTAEQGVDRIRVPLIHTLTSKYTFTNHSTALSAPSCI